MSFAGWLVANRVIERMQLLITIAWFIRRQPFWLGHQSSRMSMSNLEQIYRKQYYKTTAMNVVYKIFWKLQFNQVFKTILVYLSLYTYYWQTFKK